MQWKPDTPLTADQTSHAVIWRSTLYDLGLDNFVVLPEPTPEWYERFWGDSRETQRLKTFGHLRGKDSTSPHFCCTRGGKGWHTDPGFTRFALQIQIANPGGYAVTGVDEAVEDTPLCRPGLVHLLDTWSPHRVVRDPRLPATNPNKLLCGMDFDTVVDQAAVPRLLAHIPRLPPLSAGSIAA